MSDIDYIRMTAMLILPKCLETYKSPVQAAVEIAYALLKECQKKENEESL